nr:retrovirus-related Pol polyprotein from transposon TNT 1-94 [Tanacetum cinerariifolium]
WRWSRRAMVVEQLSGGAGGGRAGGGGALKFLWLSRLLLKKKPVAAQQSPNLVEETRDQVNSGPLLEFQRTFNKACHQCELLATAWLTDRQRNISSDLTHGSVALPSILSSLYPLLDHDDLFRRFLNHFWTEKEKVIKKNSDSVASLRSEAASLKDKGFSDAKKHVQKAHTRAHELENQVENLQRELGLKASLREVLEIGTKEIEKKMLEVDPKILEQNDVVERRNRTLFEAARTMLIFSKALMFLWAEAVATACYTQNRSLIHTRHNKTAYELVHNKKPDLTFLRVFGALCHLTNDSEDLGKLQQTANIGIFVSYAPSRKGYRIYNKRTRRIMKAIHIQFDELSEPMAPVQLNTGLTPTFFMPEQISLGLVPNLVHAAPYVPPLMVEIGRLLCNTLKSVVCSGILHILRRYFMVQQHKIKE